MRIILALLFAPLTAAVPFLVIIPTIPLNMAVMMYLTMLLLGLLAHTVLYFANCVRLGACVAAGIIEGLLLLALLPTLQSIAGGAGPVRAPALPFDAPTDFIVLVVLAGAGIGAVFWWIAEPELWPSTEDMLAHLDD